MNILVIEDDKTTLKTLHNALQLAGHEVKDAESGEVAIKLAETEKFDVILSDVMMPGISGLSLVNVLRSVNLSTVPIIMMSALHNKPLLDAAYAAGANDFIAKPFNMDEVLYKLKKFEKDETHPN